MATFQFFFFVVVVSKLAQPSPHYLQFELFNPEVCRFMQHLAVSECSLVSTPEQRGAEAWEADLAFLTAALSASSLLINSSAVSAAESGSSLDD